MICQLLAVHAFAQVKFFAVASERNLSLNQPFQVQYVVQGTKEVSKVSITNSPVFHLEDSFSTPLTTAIDHNTLQWVDTYSKIAVFTPARTGRFTIPSATITINGKKYNSTPVKVSVTQTGLSSILSPETIVEDASELKPGENVDEKVRNNFFIKAVPVKKRVYVGEPIEVDYKAYSRLNSSSQVVKRPAFPGFSVVEMVDNYDNRPEVETVKGIPFYTNLIRKVQLFPLQSGTYQLDVAEIESVIHFSRSAPKSQLESLFDGTDSRSRERFDHEVTLRTSPETIVVKPLPEKDQPKDFSGAVGQFQIKTELPSAEIRKGELTRVKWVVTGKGNLQLITLPDVEWPNNIDTSEPSVKEEINRYVYPLAGKKTFEYSFSVKDTGNYVIPALSFSYFDPEQEKYQTLTTEEVRFHVRGGADSSYSAQSETPADSDQPIHLYFFGALIAIVLVWIVYQFAHMKKSRRELERKSEEAAKTVEPVADRSSHKKEK